MTSSSADSSAVKALQRELKSLKDKPVEGFKVESVDPTNIFEWIVIIYGPPCTLYEGGYFKAVVTFPPDYPYSPPCVKFLSHMFHPNIYTDGTVCISILHQPGDDPQSGELPSERWNPTQTVSTIILSVISLLDEPNINSPANVDASVAYTKWVESKGADHAYIDTVKSIVDISKGQAASEGAVVPTTVEEYCSVGGRIVPDEAYGDDEDDYGFYNDDIIDDGDDDDDLPSCSRPVAGV